jgi:RNase H-like domain found in reverse transcriptase
LSYAEHEGLRAELNYTTVEKELLAVVYALSKLRKYLYESDFTLCTDNTAIKYNCPIDFLAEGDLHNRIW